MLDDLCFLMLNHSITAIAIKSWLFRVALTWRFLRCSGERRRQSSGWLPPNWSRPPPQSDRSPGSWGRQLRDEFRTCSNSSTVASVRRLYAWAHTSQTPFRSARSWQQDLVAVAKIQIDKWDNEASTGFFSLNYYTCHPCVLPLRLWPSSRRCPASPGPCQPLHPSRWYWCPGHRHLEESGECQTSCYYTVLVVHVYQVLVSLICYTVITSQAWDLPWLWFHVHVSTIEIRMFGNNLWWWTYFRDVSWWLKDSWFSLWPIGINLGGQVKQLFALNRNEIQIRAFL